MRSYGRSVIRPLVYSCDGMVVVVVKVEGAIAVVNDEQMTMARERESRHVLIALTEKAAYSLT